MSIFEFAQLDSGKSIIRYFAPKDTAGFATLLVSAYRRVPCPPANSIAIHFFFFIFFSLIKIDLPPQNCLKQDEITYFFAALFGAAFFAPPFAAVGFFAEILGFFASTLNI